MHGASNITTLRFLYKNRSVNAVKGKKLCLFWDPYKARGIL